MPSGWAYALDEHDEAHDEARYVVREQGGQQEHAGAPQIDWNASAPDIWMRQDNDWLVDRVCTERQEENLAEITGLRVRV